MNNFLKILKLKLRMTYISPYNLAKSKGNPLGYIIRYVVMLFGLPALMIYYGLFDSIYLMTNTSGANVKYLAVVVVLTMAMIFLSALNTIYSELFDAADNELMLSFPIQFKDIFLARLISTVASSLITSFIFVFPAFYTYVMHEGGSLSFVLYALVAWFTITYITIMILAFILLILTRVFRMALSKDSLTSLTMFISILFYFGYRLIPKDIYTGSSLTSALDIIFILKPTILSLTNAHTFVGFINMLVSFLICGILTLVLMILSENFYYANLLAGGSVSKAHNALVKKENIKSRGVITSMAWLVINRIRKTPYFFYSMYRSLFIVLSVGVASYFSVSKNLPSNLSINQLSETTNLLLKNPTLYLLFTGILAAIVAFLTAVFDNYASFIFSMEGKAYWIQQIAPIKPSQQLFARLYALYFYFIGKMVLLYVVISILLNLNPLFLFGFLGFSLILSLPVYLLKMLQDAGKPNYEWDNPNAVGGGTEKAIMDILFGLVYVALFMASGYYIIGIKNIPLLIFYYTAVSIILASVFYYLVLANIKKSCANMA